MVGSASTKLSSGTFPGVQISRGGADFRWPQPRTLRWPRTDSRPHMAREGRATPMGVVLAGGAGLVPTRESLLSLVSSLSSLADANRAALSDGRAAAALVTVLAGSGDRLGA